MDVVVYSKDDCSYCEGIKNLFTIKEIQFIEYKLDTDFTRDNFISEFGEDATFPRVLIDGTLIGGANDTVAYLQENKLL